MVGIITGSGYGLLRSSRDILGAAGQIGSGASGPGVDGIFVNAAIGSVFLDTKDAVVFGRSPAAAEAINWGVDAYQIQFGALTGSWVGAYNSAAGLTGGTVNTTGSTVERRDAEGGVAQYTYDAAKACYVNTQGGGAYDEIRWNGSVWTWTNGDTRETETYGANKKLLSRTDISGNTTTITWTANGVMQTDSSGQSVALAVESSTGRYIFTATYADAAGNPVTRNELYFTKDSAGRFASLQYDLTPDDGSIADGAVFSVGYAYDAASGNLSSITQSDGSRVDFSYTMVGGMYRVTSFTEYTSATVGRTTTLSYDLANRNTTITDANNQVTHVTYDSANQLTSIVSPAAVANGAPQTRTFAYNANGDVTSVTDENGDATVFGYDANGNRTYERDAQGNVVTRTYNLSNNRVLTETRWLTPDPDGAGSQVQATPVTTRYAYDSSNRLRFEVSAEGRVTQHIYDSYGQETATLSYTGDFYATGGMTDTQTVDEATMSSWAAARDQTKMERTDRFYDDGRSNVNRVITYSATLASGAGDTSAVKSEVDYVYDRRGQLVSRHTIGQGTETFAYDGVGRIKSSTDAANRTTSVTYQDASTTTTVTLANGTTTTSVYDRAGDLLSVTESASGIAAQTTTYAYDSLGRVRMATDPSGRKSYFLYDNDGRKTADIDGDGAVTEYRYDAGNRLVATIGWMSTINVGLLVDGNGNPTSVTIDTVRPAANANDAWGWSIYDHADRVIETIDAAGGVVTYAYDGASRLIGTTAYATALSAATLQNLKTTLPTTIVAAAPDAAHDRTSRSFYDKDGRLVAALDGVGVLSQFVYDAAGNKIREIVSANAVPAAQRPSGTLSDLQTAVGSSSADARVDYIYDRQGLLRFEISADSATTGHPRELVYDGTGNVVRTVDYAGSIALGSVTVADVSAALSAAGLTNSALNRISRSVYDAAGQLAYTINAEGAATAFVYDSLGNCIKQTQFSTAFSAAGDQSYTAMQTWSGGVAGAADRVTRQVFDTEGRLAFTVDGEGFVTGRTFDPAGRVQQETVYAASQTVSDTVTAVTLANQLASAAVTARTTYGYDAAGHVTDVTRLTDLATGATVTTHSVVDAHGQAVDVYEAWGVSGEQVQTHRDYDAAGRLITETRAKSVPNAESTVHYQYDALGDLRTVTDALNSSSVRDYDADGRLISVSVPLDSSTSAVTSYTYDSFGHVVRTTDARLNSSYLYYDRLGRLTLEVDAERFGTQTTYTDFGQAKTVTRFSTQLAAAPTIGTPPSFPSVPSADATTQFAYDRNGRLLQVTDAEGFHEDYTLNTFGDRWKVRNKLNSGTVNGETVNAFDHRGLLISETLPVGSWNSAGTLVAANIVNTFAYDASGNRTKTVEASGLTEQRTTDYAYDGLGRLWKTTHEAVAVTGTNLVSATADTTETVTYDRRGNVIQTTDANLAKTFYYYDAADRKTAAIDPTGALSTWAYDANDNITFARSYETLVGLPAQPGGAAPAGTGAYRETGYTYDRANRLTDVTVLNVTSGEYVSGTYSTTTSISSHTTYDAMGNIVRQQDGRGNSVWSWYDKNGRKTGQVDQENYLTAWSRDAEGNVKSETRFANAITAAFDQNTAVDTLKSYTGTSIDDRTTDFGYDRNGRRTSETRKNVRYANVGTTGALTETTADVAIAYTYNGLGEVTSKTEGTSDAVGYAYDGGGRLIGVTGPSFTDYTNAVVQRSVANSYDGLGNLTRTVQNGSRVTRYTYGGGGRLVSMTDASSFVRSYGYNAAGRTMIESWTRALSDNTTVTEASLSGYDAAGRLNWQSSATLSGSTWVYGDATHDAMQILYNAFGEVAKKGMNGLWQESFDYDSAGRLWRSTAGDGTAKIFVSDRDGATTVTIASSGGAAGVDLSTYTQAQALALFGAGLGTASAGAVATIAVLDRRGQQVQERDLFRDLGQSQSASIVTSRAYNAFGEVRSETDGRANTTSFSYNTMGRLTQKVSAAVSWTNEAGTIATGATPTENYYYDKSGRLVGTRDANGNLTTRTLLAGTGYGGAEASVLKEFHPDQGVVETRYNVFGDAVLAIDALLHVETRTYDAMDRLTTVAHAQRSDGPQTQLVDTYVYDGLGQRIKHTNSQFGSTVAEKTDYDAQHRVVSTIDYYGDVTTTTYSWSGTLSTSGLGTFGGWTKTTSDATLHTGTEKSDYFGRTVGKTDLGGHVFSYTFDKAGRVAALLNGASQTLGTYSWLNTGLIGAISLNGVSSSYGYDANGNRTVENDGGQESATVTFDALNRMTHFSDSRSGASNYAKSADYEYDLVGNIRHIAVDNGTAQDFWYKYDSMNRYVTTLGVLSNGRGSSIVRGSQGYDLQYDANGNRVKTSQTVSYMQPNVIGSNQYGPIFGPPTQVFIEVAKWYDYWEDGYLKAVSSGNGTQSNFNAVKPATTSSAYSYDALGRLVTDVEGSGSSAVTTTNSYDLRSQLLWQSDTLGHTSTFDYNAETSSGVFNGAWQGGAVTHSHIVSSSGTTDTKTSYVWWDSAEESVVTVAPGGASPGTSTYSYDAAGHRSSVYVQDASPHTVTYANDTDGRVLRRQDGATVMATYYYLNGKVIGDIGGTPLRTGSGMVYTNFDQSYHAIQMPSAGGNATYVVQEADTLQSIAAGLWGDSSLWYLIADANGLNGSETLAVGRTLIIPANVSSAHHSASTFAVYDPNSAWGDTQPSAFLSDAPAPSAASHKGGCGIVGTILLVAVAVAVTAITAGAAVAALAPASAGIGGIGAGLGAIAAGTTGLSAGTLIGIGAAAGALGSIASQGLGVATGLQDKFSWKGVALSALAGAVTAGIGPGGLLGKAGAFARFGGTFGSAALRGTLSSAVSQAIGVAAGLQSRFDWVGVAAAGIGAGASAQVGMGGIGGRFVSGMAGGIAGAATRSLLDGSDFGDNLIAALPEVIGDALGNMLVSGLAPATETTMQRLRREGGIELAYNQEPPNADYLRDYDNPIVVTGTRLKPQHGWGWRLADALGLHEGGLLYDSFHGRMTFDTSGIARSVASNLITAPVRIAQFGAGTVYGVYQVGRGTVVGLYHVFTTNPLTTAHNAVFGAARLVDGALRAENTPARIQVARASGALSNASSFDLGAGFGKAGANIALFLAPAAAAGRAGAVSELGRVGSGGALDAAAETSGILANGARGMASEARVLEDLGLTKNTLSVVTAEGRAIPDALNDVLSVEIKDTISVSRTAQIRIQTDAARAAGRQSILVTGTRTRVSGPATRAFDQIIRRPDLGPR